MKDWTGHALRSTLLRVLETEPRIALKDAVGRVASLASALPLSDRESGDLRDKLDDFAAKLKRRAALNPCWLQAKRSLQFHFCLVNAEGGWLKVLSRQVQSVEGISTYILYGPWDSLMVLIGTTREAEDLALRVQEASRSNFSAFSASRVLLYNRYVVPPQDVGSADVTPDVVNALASDYDAPSLEPERKRLENESIALGPTWFLSGLPEQRIRAFVGIKLTGGGHAVSPTALRDALLKEPILKTCLVHLFEIDRGYPFHYFAKLVCHDMTELDEATNAIGYARVGSVGLEGSTLVAASGREAPPQLRTTDLAGSLPTPDTGYIEEMAVQLVTHLGADAVSSFNSLDGREQLRALVLLHSLQEALEPRTWDEESETAIRAAVEGFARICVEHATKATKVDLIGPTNQIAVAVEGYLKRALGFVVKRVYGTDHSRAQNDLKLNNRDINRLTLGNIAQAFRTLRGNTHFVSLAPVLTEEALSKLDGFVKRRNSWAHAGDSPNDALLEEAHRTLVEGVEIVTWIGRDVLPAPGQSPDLRLPVPPEPGRSSVFVSHATADDVFAERVAQAAKIVTPHVWYAEWAIAPGDSIAKKVSEALAQSDILMVLLSKSSVASKWVQSELNEALLRQLRGQKVKIVPVLIEKCDVPADLVDIKFFDLTGDFNTGIVKLLGFLTKLLGEGPGE